MTTATTEIVTKQTGSVIEGYSYYLDQLFCLVGKEMYYLNEEDEWVPMTVKGKFNKVYTLDEELLGDVHDVYVQLEEAREGW